MWVSQLEGRTAILCTDLTVVLSTVTPTSHYFVEERAWLKAPWHFLKGQGWFSQEGTTCFIDLYSRYDSISESYEEPEPDLERKLRKHPHVSASRRPSIKFLNERRTTKSTYSLERQKRVTEINEPESTAMLDNTESGFATAASLNNINSLILPSITRKPSITFSETVSIIKTERRNSSPSISRSSIIVNLTSLMALISGSSLASEAEKNDLPLGKKSLSEVKFRTQNLGQLIMI